LLRRFVTHSLLPQMMIILLACVAISAVAIARGASWVAVVLWSIAACAAATALSGFISYRFFKSHIREAAEILTDAVPAARPKHDDFDVIKDIARSFSSLMDDASAQQAQLRTIIESMSDGLIATDHNQRILLTNDAAAELLAFRIPEARGKQLWEVVPIEPVLKAVTEVSLTGQRKTIAVGPVNNLHLEVTVTRLPLRPAGFIIVAHDVTETMRYEELRKEFVANVSHELRTPLTMIKGYVETLQDGAMDDRERAGQYLGTVQKHTEQLTNLVDDLLSLSRLDSTSAVPSPRPVKLQRVVARVAEMMNGAAEKKGHHLVVETSDALLPVIGNPEYLERAIANLVENAIKYTKDQGLIRIVARSENGHTIVEVIDNGIGIAAEELPRIFERFYRVERSRTRDAGGTGLGLSIVKHIAQVHGGTVEVSSTPGVGSTFHLRFPAAPAEETADADAPDAAA
jgi:two-component system phosphate regulon sensor histidine kinase PhoR